MESEGSLPCSQEPATCPFTETDESGPQLATCSSERPLPFGFPINILYAFLISPMRATCPAPLILSDWITLIIVGDVYNAPHYAVFSRTPLLPPS
jgi:hypothetical protein